ncbi:MAG: glycosyltransferase family 39 protein [Anaerolineae bacterium]|nr:glycosyltransferase family 39 protein [Anaerolineae bacterium]
MIARRVMWGGLLVGALVLALLGQFILLARSAQWVVGLAVYLAALAFLWFGLREMEGELPWLRPGREEDRRIPDTGQLETGQPQGVAPTPGLDMEQPQGVAPTLASVQPSPLELGTDLDEGDEAGLARAAADVTTSQPLQATVAAEGEAAPAVEVPAAPERPLRPLWNADLVGMWGSAALPDVRLRPLERVGELGLWLLTVACAFYGQYLMVSQPGQINQGLLLMGGAALAFLGLALRHELAGRPAVRWASLWPWSGLRLHLERLATLPTLIRSHWWRFGLILVGIGVAVFNYGLLWSKNAATPYTDAVILWLVSIACLVAACATRPLPNPVAVIARHRREALLVLALTVVAAALRLAYLGAIPDIISGDEGRMGQMTLSVVNGTLKDPFATTFGHSTLYIFVRALAVEWLGVNTLSLRLVEAIFGILAIPMTYVLARRMFNTSVALFAAALLTVSHFHLHFSRVSVNGGILDAFFTALAVFLFYSGLRSRRPLDFALSGMVVGVHLFMYMGGRLTILFLLATIVALLVVNPRLVAANLSGLAAFGLVYAVTALPMLVWAMQQPGEFGGRFVTMGILQNGWLANEMRATGRSQWEVLLQQFRVSMLAFNVYPASAFYLASKPMLDLWTAVPFALGLVYALWRAFDERFLLLNAWFWSAVIGGQVLVLNPDISAYRIMIVMPVVVILAAVAWFKLVDSAAQLLTRNRYLWGTLTMAFIALVAYVNLSYYWVDFAPNCRYEDRGTRVPSLMGSYLGTLDRDYRGYLYGEPWLFYGTHPSVDYLSGSLPVQNVRGAQAANVNFVDRTHKAVFMFVPEQVKVASPTVEQTFPGGRWVEIKDCGTPVLYAYEVAPR